MLKKLLNHALLAGVFFALTLGQQYLFYALKDIPIIWLSFGKYVAVYLFLFAATFIKTKPLRFTFLNLIIILNLFQMAHLSFFGTQILPAEIYLLFTQFGEVKGTLLVEWDHTVIPFLFTLIPLTLGVFALKRTKLNYGSHVLGILFCCYFIYNPVRTYVTGNTWGRQPSTRELAGMNVYLAFSYFSGKILPHKVMNEVKHIPNASLNLQLEKKNTHWDKVVIVLGESLTPSHMSLFGYKRPTTPHLDLKAQIDRNFFHTVALSGGVSTDISVAFLLNLGFGESGSMKAAKGQHCIFKLAHDQGYSTHFISTQSEQQLRYIVPYLCSSYLDNFKSLENISPETEDHQAARDRDVLPYFATLLQKPEKQFIIVHQRGSHPPWELRSQPENRLFPHDSKVNHYDNSVVEFDLFMKEFYATIEKSRQKILTIYLSDHGESVGENGHWGHGMLIPQSFEVPLMISSVNDTLPHQARKLPKYIPHYNVSLFIAEALGYVSNQDVLVPVPKYIILGNDIDGFAGHATISYGPDSTYNFEKVLQ